MTKTTRNLLVDLRSGTEAEHRRLERHPLLHPLMSSSLTLDQYSRVIAAFTGFHAALELRIREMSSSIDFPDYRYEPRLPLLAEDRTALPFCDAVPCTAALEYARDADLVGMLYVLEGATQGGRVIAPWVQQQLALTDSAGLRYFNFYRQNSWGGFRNMVERNQPLYDSPVAVAAAQATFDHLYSHLDHCLSSFGD